jgi:hypothetical protein
MEEPPLLKRLDDRNRQAVALFCGRREMLAAQRLAAGGAALLAQLPPDQGSGKMRVDHLVFLGDEALPHLLDTAAFAGPRKLEGALEN